MSKPVPTRVLIADDEPPIIEEYRRALTANPDGEVLVALSELREELFAPAATSDERDLFIVDTCTQGDEAVERVRVAAAAGEHYAAVFLDVNMPPGINGIEAARQIRAIDPLTNIVIVSGAALMQPESLAAMVPPSDRLFVFKKPFHNVEFRQLATALCGKWQAHKALRLANESLEDNVRQRTRDLFDLAYFDPATRLPNRRRVLEDLGTRIRNLDANGQIAVVLLDLERFNFINETMGYEFGTGVLREVAARLNATLRDGDIAARFGADSFACLVGSGHTARLPAMVERIRNIFTRPFEFEQREIHVKCSMGVAVYPDHGNTCDEVFRCAEAALHRSKRDVIRETIFYDTRMGAVALRRLTLETEVRAAIEKRHIRPFFQPQIDLATGEVCGVEVLARWLKPDGSIVPPDNFVPLIEEAGLAGDLFESILCQAAPMVGEWRRQLGYTGQFSVNVSAHQVGDEAVATLAKTVLADCGLDASLLELELTETVLLSDFEVSRAWLAHLRGLGLKVHIDDFGTGYSSLQYLADLTFDGLKIDRSFINRLTESQSQQRIVDAIIALGQSLGAVVTAEGVETQAQLDLVTACRCDFAQGYFIGRPMPDSALRDWLAARQAPARKSSAR